MNAADFREALSHFASGVTVVTARASQLEGEEVGQVGQVLLVGFTATSFASVSLSPPIILVCVSHTASAYAGFVRAPAFGVSVLEQSQAWIAEQFARKNVDRFQGVPLVAGRATPLVEGALAHVECRMHARSEVGDHSVVFGEVLSASARAGLPLVYFGRRFGALERETPPSPEPIGAADGGEA